ncbi:hypothetical protein [Halorubrum salinum]|uniref:hypothetical protein n=1 Tax=Halorubrum salinum TaxID=767517 RepID=UPI002111AD7F|nr:hypothetical protein [Halorubrum salinum]
MLGLCVSTALVTWLLYELTLALDPESTAALIALVATLGSLFYLVSWLEELGRQTLIYVGTWRYGGPI